MIEFHRVTAEDCQWARPLLMQSGYRTCEYAFTDVFMWSILYNSHIGRYKNYVTVRSEVNGGVQYLYPAGFGGMEEEKEMVQCIIEDAQAHGCKPVFYGMPTRAKERLEEHFPGKFEYTDLRDRYDYLYSSEELAELPGKKFQKKRNHVSRFIRENPDWKFQVVTPEALPRIREFSDYWYESSGKDPESGIDDERRAVEWVFDHFCQLDLCAGYLTVGGKIVAFSYGSAINDRVFDTQVEKALHTVNGAYAMINREMARAFGIKYEFINREDDVGDEGLRKAKLSYNPAMMGEKWQAEWIG